MTAPGFDVLSSPAATRTITVELRPVPDSMPDADTDVLIFVEGETEAQLGAYVGHDVGGAPVWVNADGGFVGPVIAWCEMPRLPA